jgi:hypothetical protein
VGQVDGVLTDVALGHQVGFDADGGIGDEQIARVTFHLHDENVADATIGADAGIARQYFAHKFVSVQAALHQDVGIAFACQ